MLALALGLAACGGEPEPAPSEPYIDTFATSRSVTVRVTASAERLGAAQAGVLTLQRPNGDIVSKGSISANRAAELWVVIPSTFITLRLELEVEGRVVYWRDITFEEVTTYNTTVNVEI